MRKPWDEMSDDEKLGEVMDLTESYRNQSDFVKILEEKMDVIAELVHRLDNGEVDIDPFITEIVEIGNWWTSITNPPERD